MRVRGSFRKVRGEIEVHVNLAHAQIVIAQSQRIFNGCVEADGYAFGLMLARKAEKILDDTVSALSLLVELFRITEGLWADLTTGSEQLAVAQDGGERIIQLMSYAGDELSDRSQRLAVQ